MSLSSAPSFTQPNAKVSQQALRIASTVSLQLKETPATPVMETNSGVSMHATHTTCRSVPMSAWTSLFIKCFLMFIKHSTSLDPCLCPVGPCSSSIWLNIPCWGLHVEHYMFNKSLIWLISRTRSDRRSPIHQCLKILKCFIQNSNYHNRIVYFLFSSHFHN